MSSMAFQQAVAACDAVDAALDKLGALDADALSHPERLTLLERGESWRRRLPAVEHDFLNELGHASTEELGGSLARVLADRLRIYRGEVSRRIEEAADLGPRRALTGEPLAPTLEATAAGQRAGRIGDEHIRIIRTFFARLPHCADAPTRAKAEAKLAEVAAAYRPDELKRFADWYAGVLNPDGTFSDEDRARKRAVSIGPQGPDGMSKLTGWLNPELRSGLDAVLAKLAAPGMCNPADEHPTIEGEPSEQAIDADHRSPAQRSHDALNAGYQISHS
jgi:hypothetical protein